MPGAARTPLTMTKERLAEAREWAVTVKSEPLAYPKAQHLLNDVIAELDAECAARNRLREVNAALVAALKDLRDVARMAEAFDECQRADVALALAQVVNGPKEKV